MGDSLGRASFVDLLVERPEVAIAVMRVLVRRLRSRVRDVATAEARVAAPPSAVA